MVLAVRLRLPARRQAGDVLAGADLHHHRQLPGGEVAASGSEQKSDFGVRAKSGLRGQSKSASRCSDFPSVHTDGFAPTPKRTSCSDPECEKARIAAGLSFCCFRRGPNYMSMSPMPPMPPPPGIEGF